MEPDGIGFDKNKTHNYLLPYIAEFHFSICTRRTTLFDTTSLRQDYLHEVVSIQGPAHIADVGSSPLISRLNYENMWARPREGRAHDPTSNMSVGIRPNKSLYLHFMR